MTVGDLRALERASIESFLAVNAGVLDGARVLDYGCGRQPYRVLIEGSGGVYSGYDERRHPGALADGYEGGHGLLADGWGSYAWDVIVCTQVVQYVPDVYRLLRRFRDALGGGVLLMTGPVNWPEVENDDLHRFTRSGITRLLRNAGFETVEVERRAVVPFAPGFALALGWQAVARP